MPSSSMIYSLSWRLWGVSLWCVAQEGERSHASRACDLTRGPGKAVPRSPCLDSYPGSYVADHPEPRQYRGISSRVLPVLGIYRGDRRGHGRGHPNRSLGERVSRAVGRRGAKKREAPVPASTSTCHLDLLRRMLVPIEG